MGDLLTRAQLLGLTGDMVQRTTGRQLRRAGHRRAAFSLFRGGAGTGTGIVLIIAGILAVAFVIYSIWLRRKKQRERQAQGADEEYQQQQQVVYQPKPAYGKPVDFPYADGKQQPDQVAHPPTV